MAADIMTGASIKVDGFDRPLSVTSDSTDLRDKYYEPSLAPLAPAIEPEIPRDHIRNQLGEGSCTGFALAAVVDFQCCKQSQGTHTPQVSARMLYEMAKLHDETLGRNYKGSTIRAALKGFYHNGVCLDDEAPYLPNVATPPWDFSMKRAEAARNISLGAYYRLNHEIDHYHSAIDAAGAVIVSAGLHSGWRKPVAGKIRIRNDFEGLHAFAIVGYTQDGFIVQNSWGPNWGGYRIGGDRQKAQGGLALWSYDDWSANVLDAWVLRLAISSPRAFNIKFARNHKQFKGEDAARKKMFAPRRQDIFGHYIHMNDGDLVAEGRYAAPQNAITVMQSAIREAAARPKSPCKHLLFFAHGAMQNKFDVAKRITAWGPTFEKNGIYPIHFMWETGFNNEVVNVIKDLLFKTRERMGTTDERIDDGLEAIARPLGRKLWRDLKKGAKLSCDPLRETSAAIQKLATCAAAPDVGTPLKLHFASQSAGALLLGNMIHLIAGANLRFETASLLAPACSTTFYDSHIRDHVGSTIKSLVQYSLTEHRELADHLEIYRKSLLYLISNAIEDEIDTPILGLEHSLTRRDAKAMAPLPDGHTVHFAGKPGAPSDAKSHRDFDSDRKTMNHLLETIIGEKPRRRAQFTKADMQGYSAHRPTA